MNWIKLILIASDLPEVILTIVGLLCLKISERSTRVFSVFVIYSGIIQITALVLWLMHRNNMPLLHLYVPSGFVLLFLFYSSLLKDVINKGLMLFIMVAFVMFSLINSIFFQTIFTFNSYALSVESILLIILSIFTYLVFLSQKKDAAKVQETAGFIWINSGIFLYYTADLLLFYFGTFIMNHLTVSASSFTWVFHSFYSIVMNCLFIIGLWKRRKIFL